MNETKTKTPISLALGYGIGELGSQMSFYLINTYLMLFYTDIVTLSAEAISIIMLIARVWDAINDPMMGMICDRTHTRWGRFRPYIMFATPFLAIFNILTFTVFPVEGMAKAVLCLVCYIGAGMAFTIVTTAYASLVNVLSLDSQVRQTLSAARNAFNSLGSIVLGAMAMPLILFFGNSDTANAKGFFWTAVIMSIIIIPVFWITAATCKEQYGEMLHAQEANLQKRSIWESVKNVCKNDQLICAVLSTLGGTIGVMGRMTMLSYYIIYVVGSYTMIAPLYTIMSVCALIGSLFISRMTALMGKRNYMLLLNGLMVVSFLALFLNPHVSIPFLVVCSILAGFANSTQGVSFGLVSDSIEYGDWKNGVREEGLCCSFLTLAVKLATAIVGAGGVLLLNMFGYVPNQQQTEAAVQGINIVVNLIPAICVALGCVPLLFYKLSNQRVAEIGEELKKRNQQ